MEEKEKMIITVYTKDDEHYTFMDIKEFTVAGGVQIVGTSEVDFGTQGFRFTATGENNNVCENEPNET